MAASDLRLLDAVKRRDHKGFAALLRTKAEVNATQPDGATALAWASYLDDRESAVALLAAGAKVNTADEYGETPLTLACSMRKRTIDGGVVRQVINDLDISRFMTDVEATSTVSQLRSQTSLSPDPVLQLPESHHEGKDIYKPVLASYKRAEDKLSPAEAQQHMQDVSRLLRTWRSG